MAAANKDICSLGNCYGVNEIMLHPKLQDPIILSLTEQLCFMKI